MLTIASLPLLTPIPVIGESHTARINSVQKLLESSSAAKQINNSANPAAMDKHQEAKSLYQQAREADAKGDAETRDRLLQETTKTMMQAVRMAGMEELTAEKKRLDYQSRKESVQALMLAYQRISSEKGSSDADLAASVNTRINQAEKLFQAGDLDAARKQLDNAYVEAKTAIEALRGGDTLVRSLTFSSKKDEYDYELDRNDTHQMLVTVLLAEKMQNAGVQKMVQPFLDQAAQLRTQAETEATGGNYEQGVKTLEESTRQLVRAIRGAGIYIPG